MRMRVRRYLHSIVFVLLAVAPGVAQQDISIRIDRYLRAEMERQKIPGVSLAIVRNGKISLLKTYGLANVEHQVPVKPETVFQSGSIGKQFTAAAIMILAQDGKISLDDKISRYLPDAPPEWKDITVQHLLTHTSGMGDYPPEVSLQQDYTEAEYFELIKKSPLKFNPGAKWDYSNLGYVTLGIMIHRITGKFYGDFLAERVFKPLGMSTARVISEADIIPNRAAGYRLVAGELKNQEWVSPSTNTTADGSLYLTILDLAKWDAALYTDTPLKRSSRTSIWAPVKLNDGTRKAYGFGWHTDLLHNRRVVFHGGAWQGFKSHIIRFLDDKLTIIFFANSWNTNDFKLARGLAAIFYPEFALPLTIPIEDREPEVTSLIRRVLLQLSEGNADPDFFTAELRAKLFPDQIKRFGEKLNSISLPVAVVHLSELVERRDENNLRVYRFLLTDLGRTLSCTVKLTTNGKIAFFELAERNG